MLGRSVGRRGGRACPCVTWLMTGRFASDHVRRCSATAEILEGGKAPLAAAEKSRSDIKAGAREGNHPLLFRMRMGCPGFSEFRCRVLSSLGWVGYQRESVMEAPSHTLPSSVRTRNGAVIALDLCHTVLYILLVDTRPSKEMVRYIKKKKKGGRFEIKRTDGTMQAVIKTVVNGHLIPGRARMMHVLHLRNSSTYQCQ